MPKINPTEAPEFPLSFVMILAFLSVLYAPVWLLDYFYHDDLLFFLKPTGPLSGFAVTDKVMAHGRFLAAGLISITGWLVHHLASLRWLRFANIIGLGIFGALAAREFSRILNNPFSGLLAAMGLLTLPAFSLIVTWAANVLIPLTLILGWMAAELAVKGRMWLAALLLFFALCIYQSAAMIFWPAGFLIIYAGTDVKRRTKNFVLAALAGLAAYGLLFWISGFFIDVGMRQGMYGPPIIPNLSKLIWFIKEPLANVLNAWNLGPAPHILICLFIWLFFVVMAVRSTVITMGMIGLLFLSFLPNLAVQEPVGFYRCSLPLTVMVGVPILMVIGRSRFAKIILIMVVLYGCFRAQATVMDQRVLPSVREKVYTRGVLSAMESGRYDGLQIIRRDRAVVPSALYDEWGTFSLDYFHNGFLFAVFAAKEGWGCGVFPYIFSQVNQGTVDYCVVKGTSEVLPDGRKTFAEVGNRGYMRLFLPLVNTPAMTYFYDEGALYFFFRQGPWQDGGKNIVFDLNDL